MFFFNELLIGSQPTSLLFSDQLCLSSPCYTCSSRTALICQSANRRGRAYETSDVILE